MPRRLDEATNRFLKTSSRQRTRKNAWSSQNFQIPHSFVLSCFGSWRCFSLGLRSGLWPGLPKIFTIFCLIHFLPQSGRQLTNKETFTPNPSLSKEEATMNIYSSKCSVGNWTVKFFPRTDTPDSSHSLISKFSLACWSGWSLWDTN